MDIMKIQEFVTDLRRRAQHCDASQMKSDFMIGYIKGERATFSIVATWLAKAAGLHELEASLRAEFDLLQRCTQCGNLEEKALIRFAPDGSIRCPACLPDEPDNGDGDPRDAGAFEAQLASDNAQVPR